jgi:hypothetical protein
MKWAVLFGPARHGRAYTVPCSERGMSPSGGTARLRVGPNCVGLKRAGPSRARVGPGRAAHLDIYSSSFCTHKFWESRTCKITVVVSVTWPLNFFLLLHCIWTASTYQLHHCTDCYTASTNRTAIWNDTMSAVRYVSSYLWFSLYYIYIHPARSKRVPTIYYHFSGLICY